MEDVEDSGRGRGTNVNRVGYCLEDVGSGVVLDSRLALVNREAGWMAVADLHYGYELRRRAEGGLFPLWGMGAVEDRMKELVDHHRPERVILAGDLMDGNWGVREAVDWLGGLGEKCEMICVRGNHDRGGILEAIDFVDWHREDGFFFHHGDREWEDLDCGRMAGEIEVIGHYHPALSLRDGAGTTLKLPALVQENVGKRRGRWVLPAFSPWAGGGAMEIAEGARYFGCGRGRIIRG